ncbi:50S ribosomal protein L11 methyltransferase [Patescibacteria group bacterium]|nr:50S ribosomal protein L11 methyltransferase [Patescibacteria group bacterium]
MKYFAELGQNAELSLAELLAVYPKIKIIFKTDKAVIFESDEKPDIERLGGTPKLGEVISENKLPKEIILIDLEKESKEKKIFFGISFYGAKADKNLGREIKKNLIDRGRKVRWVIGKEKVLSSVIVRTNKLLRRGGEYCILSPHLTSPRVQGEEGEKTSQKDVGDGHGRPLRRKVRGGIFVAKTFEAQNFSDYEFRDMKRPARDLISGMTPPKLAKMLINLGLGSSPFTKGGGEEGDFLDPFCGSGTLLMEAALLGIKNIYGSDVSARAVEDTSENLAWLFEKYKLSGSRLPQVKKCDVKNLADCWEKKFGLIVGEPYLGPAIRGGISPDKAQMLQQELEKNYDGYLKGLSESLKKNGRLVLIVPFIITNEKVFYLDVDIKKYGLKVVQEPILYSRPDQKIGREIYILEKI